MTRRYAVCGLSSRALSMFVEPLLADAALGEVVAIVDVDQERVEAFRAERGVAIPCYPPEEFDRMVDTERPDALIVTSTDVTHADYILAGLGRDLDVLCEKPMVIDCGQAARVLEAEQRSGGSLRVTHNSRYRPAHMHVKRLISGGRIGAITNVELTWNLDTYHGASYFWRWNRLRSMSGGLTITKASHHFDLLNWWLDDVPEQVFAYARRNYYGPASLHNPSRRDGVPYSPDEQRARSPYEQRWRAETRDDHHGRRRLPYPAMYPSDRPLYIFDEEIDIEDTYSAVIRYRGAASVAYSLNASAPWEGYVLGINGTHGRIETVHYTEPSRVPFPIGDHQTVTLMPLFGEIERAEFPVAGGHGGSDERLRHELFVGDLDEGRGLGLAASGLQAAYAVAIGEAVWRSAAEDRPISIPELLPATREASRA
jgi:predicted dehydrogenase